MSNDTNEFYLTYFKLSDFMERVTEMYLYNLEHYPDEKPTIDGAFREVLLQISQELWEDWQKFQAELTDNETKEKTND